MADRVASSKQIETFALSLADIAAVEPDKLHALSLSVRWPHRAEDWAFLREVGHGFAALDDIGRVMATAMWFPQGASFATVGMVITSPRLQTLGTGQWLMKHLLQHVPGQPVELNATRAAKRLYLSLGFLPQATVYQRQGEAGSCVTPPPNDGEILRELGTADTARIEALDRRAARCDRGDILAALVPRSQAWGLFRDGTLAAFAFARPFGRGTVIGPVVAERDADAVTVVAPHLAARTGAFVRLDTRQAAGAFSAFLDRAGLPVFDTVTTMSAGPARFEADVPLIYGLITQATG